MRNFTNIARQSASQTQTFVCQISKAMAETSQESPLLGGSSMALHVSVLVRKGSVMVLIDVVSKLLRHEDMAMV